MGEKELDRLVFEQGYSMHKPSEITAALQIDKTTISRVQVGGKALISGEKEIAI